MRTLLCALALGLMLAPAAAALEPAVFTASSLKAVGPDAGTLRAELATLVIDDPLAPGEEPLPLPPFSVAAKAMHIETDSARFAVHGPGSRVAPVPYDTAVQRYADAQLQQLAERGGYRVDILEAVGASPPTVTLSDGCFGLETYPEPSITRTPIVNGGRPARTIPLGDAIAASQCGAVTITVEGTFQLRLWQADVLLTADGNSQVLRTGAITYPAIQGQPAEVSEDREAFIRVEDGVFRSPYSNNTHVLLREAHGQLDGTVVLSEATGRLPAADPATMEQSSLAIEDETLALIGGPMTVRIRGHGPDPMEVTVEGDWQPADGRTAPLGDDVRAAPGLAPIGLLVVSLAAAFVRRRA